MSTFFIFHGTGGYPEENWFPWMKRELEARGHRVFVPQFPTPENQTPEAWFEVFNRYKNEVDEDTTLIGHSLGGTFLFLVLEQLERPLKAAFIVAAPTGILPIKNYATDKPFLEKPFDWAKIRANARRFFVFQSDNDPFMTPLNGQDSAKNLHTELITVPGAGHFNTAAGYTRFDLLLEKIEVDDAVTQGHEDVE